MFIYLLHRLLVMIPTATSPRPSELYEKLEGKYVQVQGANALYIGKLQAVDLQNGVLILDEVPILDPTQKKLTTENTRIIPFGSDTIGELTHNVYLRLIR